MKMKNLSYLLVVLSLLFVGCNDDDNDDDANLPEVGKAFAATTEHWYMDLDGFEGAFKTAYDEMKAVLKTKDAIPGQDRKSTRLNSSHTDSSRMPSSA